MTIEIKCINKDDRYDPYESIQYIGGINPDGKAWKLSLAKAVAGVEDGTYSFYVYRGGKSVNVIVALSGAGNKYLKTVDDDYKSNNLLTLPECPK
jgi:hypothetical protein